MSTTNGAPRLERLLEQLYAKKNWLDTMISGLESAVQSADHQFIESVTRTFSRGQRNNPKVDIHRRQRARLARLATRVTRSGASRTRSGSKPSS